VIAPVGSLDHSATGTFDLSAGKYVLFCNMPGHYQSGMSTNFEVEQSCTLVICTAGGLIEDS
jgi:hypothetical protein